MFRTSYDSKHSILCQLFILICIFLSSINLVQFNFSIEVWGSIDMQVPLHFSRGWQLVNFFSCSHILFTPLFYYYVVPLTILFLMFWLLLLIEFKKIYGSLIMGQILQNFHELAGFFWNIPSIFIFTTNFVFFWNLPKTVNNVKWKS